MNFHFLTANLAAFSLTMAAGFPLGTLANPVPNHLALNQVLVTANRWAQPLTDIVADVTVIDAYDIARSGAVNLIQLLSGQAGIQIIGSGDASRIFIRGAESRMTALFLDGIRIDSQDGVTLLGGGAPWELLPLTQIERIEILRGPASAVYGSDAMGGVVQIFTKSGLGKPQPYVDVSFGSNSAKHAKGGLSGKHDAFSYSIGMSYEDTLGFNTRPDLTHTPEREPSTRRSVNLKLGYQANLVHALEFSSLDSQLDYQYVPWLGGRNYLAHGTLAASSLKWHADWSQDFASNLIWSTSKVNKQDDAPYAFETVKQNLAIENTLRRVGGGTVTAVLEHKSDAFASTLSPYDAPFYGQRDQNALAMGYGKVLGPHVFQMNLRHDHDELFGFYGTGAVAYAYAFGTGWRATASTGSGFRSPTLEQNFGPYGSRDLQPEMNHSSELGLNFANSNGSFHVLHYRNSISNLISSNAASSACSALAFCYYNVGQALITGVTLSGKIRLNKLDLKASLDSLNPRDEVTGRQLSLRARQVLSTTISGQLEGWNWGVDVQGIGPRFDDAANTKVLAGYGVINLSGTKLLVDDWTLTARIDNIGNRKYEEVGNYATPGRTFLVGLKWMPKN